MVEMWVKLKMGRKPFEHLPADRQVLNLLNILNYRYFVFPRLKPWAKLKPWAIYKKWATNLLNKSSSNATSLAGDIAEKEKRIEHFEQPPTLKPFNPTTLKPSSPPQYPAILFLRNIRAWRRILCSHG